MANGPSRCSCHRILFDFSAKPDAGTTWHPLVLNLFRPVTLLFKRVQYGFWCDVVRDLFDFLVLVGRKTEMLHHRREHGGDFGDLVLGKQIDLQV